MPLARGSSALPSVLLLQYYSVRKHLQTYFHNVKMTFRVGGGYPHDVNVQKCMHQPTFLVKIVILEKYIGQQKKQQLKNKISSIYSKIMLAVDIK